MKYHLLSIERWHWIFSQECSLILYLTFFIFLFVCLIFAELLWIIISTCFGLQLFGSLQYFYLGGETNVITWEVCCAVCSIKMIDVAQPRSPVHLDNRSRQNGHHFSNAFRGKLILYIDWISLISVSLCLFVNARALVQVMACHQTCDRPLPKPTPTQFTDAQMFH